MPNIKGLLYVSRAVLPGMVARKRGHVVNIGSIAGHEVYPAGNVYCATKHAVRAINKGMRLDCWAPGSGSPPSTPAWSETEFSLVRFHGDSARAQKVYRGLKPLGGADVARAVVWACGLPGHVNVEDMVITPTDQASATMVNRTV